MLSICQFIARAFDLAFLAVKRQEFFLPKSIGYNFLEGAMPEVEVFACPIVPGLIVWITIGCPATGIEFAFTVEENAFVAYETDA